MLIVGTSTHLEDLDREYTLAEDVSVTALASSPAGPGTPHAAGTVYALLDGERVARVGEFELVPRAVLPGGGGQSMAATAAGGLVIGMEGAHLGELDPESGAMRAVDAFDSVGGRDSWENPAAPTPDLRSLAVSVDGTWFVNVHVGGLWRLEAGGGSFEQVVEPEADIHEVCAGSGGIVAVAAAKGFGWSRDGGATWSFTADGLHAPYCRAVALDGDVAYVSASTGPRTTDGRLYRCRLGEPLRQCTAGLPESFPFNIDTGSVTARSGEVAFGTHEGQVYRSADGGSTFELLGERMHPVRVLRYL
jgi:hypothetical protein